MKGVSASPPPPPPPPPTPTPPPTPPPQHQAAPQARGHQPPALDPRRLPGGAVPRQRVAAVVSRDARTQEAPHLVPASPEGGARGGQQQAGVEPPAAAPHRVAGHQE